MTSERLSRRLVRAFIRSLAPCAVLAAVLFALLYLAVLPKPGVKIDLARAKAIVAAQRFAPVIVLHLVLVMSGVVLPWARGDRPARAAWIGASRLPAIWLHALAAQLMIALGLVAGVVPGVLALAPAAMMAAAVADGAHGREAFAAASAAAAPRRWPLIAVVVGIVVVEIGLTVATWKALVPPLGKKTPAVGLLAASRYAWINAIRAAVTAPLFATLLAGLYASWRPQAASAARTAPASAHATTS